MKLHNFEDILDSRIGLPGSTERDTFDKEVQEHLYAYKLGLAIREARISQNLTQQQLGERIGVGKSQISKVERGYRISLPTMISIFKALGAKIGMLDLGNLGKVALW